MRYLLTMRKSICQNPTRENRGKSGMPPTINRGVTNVQTSNTEKVVT